MSNRRDFLKSVALFGAAAATTATLPTQNLLAQNIAHPRPVDRDGLFAMAYREELVCWNEQAVGSWGVITLTSIFIPLQCTS